MRVRWLLLLVLALPSTVACGDAERASAEDAVRAFHDHFNAGAFDIVYAAASPEFRAATRQEDWVSLLEAIRRKAGRFETANQDSWFLNSGSAGTTVTVTYTSKFERLSAMERFSWRIEGKKAVLLGYRIDSPDLIRN